MTHRPTSLSPNLKGKREETKASGLLRFLRPLWGFKCHRPARLPRSWAVALLQVARSSDPCKSGLRVPRPSSLRVRVPLRVAFRRRPDRRPAVHVLCAYRIHYRLTHKQLRNPPASTHTDASRLQLLRGPPVVILAAKDMDKLMLLRTQFEGPGSHPAAGRRAQALPVPSTASRHGETTSDSQEHAEENRCQPTTCRGRRTECVGPAAAWARQRRPLASRSGCRQPARPARVTGNRWRSPHLDVRPRRPGLPHSSFKQARSPALCAGGRLQRNHGLWRSGLDEAAISVIVAKPSGW